MKRYRVHNWGQYNQSLIQRGSLDIWIDEKALKLWRAPRAKGRNGHPLVYSKEAVLLLLVLKAVYHLTYRSLQGFVTSLFRREGVDFAVPSYSQTCRRAQSMLLPRWLGRRRPRAIIIDSTGLKIYGEGEWFARKHGFSKRRTWKKLHVVICSDTQELIATEMTDANVSDDQMLSKLLESSPRSVREVIGDGAYDTRECYRTLHRAGAKGIIPPRKNATYDWHADDYWQDRNQGVLEIRLLGNDAVARKIWKKGRGYHRRSLVETTMYRYKQLLGEKLYSRLTASQRSETVVKALILNRMSNLGLPDSSWT